MADEPGPAKKISLFKKSPFAAPNWPAPSDGDESDSDEDFFSRSKHTYALLAADEEERKKRRREAQREESASDDPTTPSRKKLRSSPDIQAHEPGIHPHQPEERSTDNRLLEPTNHIDVRSAHENSKAAARDTLGAVTSDLTPVLEIDSGDEDVVITSFRAQDPDTPSPPAPSPKDSLAAATTTPKRSKEDGLTDDDVLETSEAVATSSNEPATSPQKPSLQAISHADEPKVSVLITSSMSNTSALIVQRKLGQRLKEARLEWCSRQLFTPEQTSQIVLTWRGKRVYDSTSCRALGIGTDVDGNIVGEGEKDLFGIEDRRIHMEAMTEEMLQKAKQARLNPKTVAERESAVNPTSPVREERRMRLILKSSGIEELKFLVKPTFLVSRLLSEFRERRQIEESRQISIHFDGEELGAETTIEDCEIDDMDTLDVYIK